MTILVTAILAWIPMTADAVTFGSGASVAADGWESEGTWALIVFAPGGDGSLILAADTGYEQRVMQARRAQTTIGTGANAALPGWWLPVEGNEHGTTVRLIAQNSWSAAFIQAEAITLRGGALNAPVAPYGPYHCINHWLTHDQDLRRLLPPSTCPDSSTGAAVMATLPIGGLAGSKIAARGVNQIVVHNFEVRCTTPSCPEGGHRRHEEMGIGSLGSIQYFETSYGELTMEGAQLSGIVNATVLVVGGSRVDLAASGMVRLPLASGDACAADEKCFLADDQTLRAWGLINLDGIHPTGTAPARLQAEFSGEVVRAQLDATALGVERADAAVLAAGITALLAAAVKIALGVLATRTKQDPLSHPNRKKLYDYILNHPGGTFREVIRGTEIPAGTARHHLAILRQTNLIQEHGHKATLRYFENHGRFDDSWNTVVMLREPELKRLHKWLLKHPGSMQREILDAAGTDWGWSRSTTQHRLKRLSEEGLIDVKLQGRLKLYTAKQRAPVPV